VKPLKLPDVEREFLTEAELAAVIAAVAGSYKLMFRIAGTLGLRRGELLGLRWGDIELAARRLHVRQTYGQHGFGEPKSRAGRRRVPLTPRIVDELRAHQKEQPPNRDDLVFTSRNGTPLDPDNVNRVWKRTLRTAGVRDLPFHALRHTAVSLLLSRERLNPKQLSQIVGHASVQLTFDTYGHLMPDAFDGFGAGLDGLGLYVTAADESSVAQQKKPSLERLRRAAA
jgi:integrase